jgi:hypothetical protein
MKTSIETKELSADEILRDIIEKRKEYDMIHPLEGRKWYFATGQNSHELIAKYPHDTVFEFHYFIPSKDILVEVLTNLLNDDTTNLSGIKEFLRNKTAPFFLFNYCFDFK